MESRLTTKPKGSLGIIAILDVDHTLLGHQGELNEALINALKENHIEDVYLFTDMARLVDCKERLKLCNQLEQHGLKVHGVITSMDLAWDMSNKQADTVNAIIESPENRKKRLEEFITEDLTKTCKECATQAQLGKAFDDIIKRDDREDLFQGGEYPHPNPQDPYVVLIKKMNLCKYITDILSFEKDAQNQLKYQTTKGPLFDLFLKQKPAWGTACVLFDDKGEIVSDIKNIAEKHPDFSASAIQVHYSADDTQNEFKNQSAAQKRYSQEIKDNNATLSLLLSVIEIQKSCQHFNGQSSRENLQPLIDQLTEIQKDPLLTHSKKAETMINAISQVYGEKATSLLKEKTFLTKEKKYPTYGALINALNTKQNDFHSLRMLGLLLKTAYDKNLAKTQVPVFDIQFPSDKKVARHYPANLKQASAQHSLKPSS